MRWWQWNWLVIVVGWFKGDGEDGGDGIGPAVRFVAIVSPDSTQTSLTIYTQKATVAWLAMAEWSGLPFWLRLVESVVPFPVRSH